MLDDDDLRGIFKGSSASLGCIMCGPRIVGGTIELTFYLSHYELLFSDPLHRHSSLQTPLKTMFNELRVKSNLLTCLQSKRTSQNVFEDFSFTSSVVIPGFPKMFPYLCHKKYFCISDCKFNCHKKLLMLCRPSCAYHHSHQMINVHFK